MSYILTDPVPSIQDIGPMSESIGSGSISVMWQTAVGSGDVHFIGFFGGLPNDWYAIYANLTDDTSYFITGLRGTPWAMVYSPTAQKIYIGTNYDGSLAEIDPNTSPPTVTTISESIGAVSYGMVLGDDNRIYYMTYGNDPSGFNKIYSYDPTLGMPSGWRTNIPVVGVGTNDQRCNIAVDTSYMYATIRISGDPLEYSLMISPIDTPSWSAWEFASSTTKFLYVYKKAITGEWILARQLTSDNSYLYYYLSGGTYTLIGSSPPTEADPQNDLNYCYPASHNSPGDRARWGTYYGYLVDITEMFPMRGNHEYSEILYKTVAAEEWTPKRVDYSGTWDPVPIKCMVPHPNSNSMMCLSFEGTAALYLNYLIPESNYLGCEVMSPYELARHPVSGEYYLGGYSNQIYRFNPVNSWTLTTGNIIPISGGGSPYPPVSATNPFSMALPTSVHYWHCIDFDINGLVWAGGFIKDGSPDYGDVIWYNPIDGSADNIFQDWHTSGTMFSNLCASFDRTKIFVSDRSANIWVIDAATKFVDETPIIPVDNGTAKTYMVAIDSNTMLGIVVVSTGATSGNKIVKFNPNTKTVSYLGDIPSGQPFGFSDAQTNRMFWKLTLGPDNYVWMFISNTLYRINIADCSFNSVLTTTFGKIAFAPNNLDLLIYYADAGINVGYYPSILTYAADYSRGSYVSLPADDTDLDTPYTGDDITDVATDDTDMVAQLATSQNAIHQFKQQIDGAGGIINVVAQVTIPCSTSTTYLQIYNRSGTPAWDIIDSDNATGANTDFTLSATVADLTDYKDENNIVACRVYQEMQ